MLLIAAVFQSAFILHSISYRLNDVLNWIPAIFMVYNTRLLLYRRSSTIQVDTLSFIYMCVVGVMLIVLS